MFRRLFLLGAAALALAVFAVPAAGLAALGALAFLSSSAAAAEVSIPYGDALAGFGFEHIAEILIAVALWLARKLPASVFAWLQSARADQLLFYAIRYGVNAVAGASAEKKLDLSIGSEVLANAIRYAVENAPGLVRWLGGPELLRDKLIARLTLEEAVSKEDLVAGLEGRAA